MDRYLLETAGGGLKLLDVGREISQEQVVQLQWKGCEVKAFAFWYGPVDKVAGSAATVIEKNVNGCP